MHRDSNEGKPLDAPGADMRPAVVMVLTWLIAGLLGCEKNESDAPEFDGLTGSLAISSSQISLVWSAARDDQNHRDEIVYPIWVAESGVDLDADGPPQFVTGEGATSYCLQGLNADTEYQVLVRAEDRGGNRSENSALHVVRTAQVESGLFVAEQSVAVDRDVASITVGTIETGRPRVIGTVEPDRVAWWRRHEIDGWIPANASAVTSEEDIVEAHLVPLRERDTDDLFLVTVRGLVQLHNNGSASFSAVSEAFFPEVPQRNTIHFVDLDDDGHLDVTYANPLGRIVFYRGDGNGGLTSEGAIDSNGNAQAMHVFHVDDEDGLDLVLLTDLGLAVLRADEGDFTFRPIAWTGLPIDEPGPFDSFLAGDDDGDGDMDVHLYVRHEIDHITRLFRYPNNGEGEFDAVEEVDFASAAYSPYPETADLDRDGATDIVFPQPESNDAVVYFGGSNGWSDAAYSVGGDDAPDQVWIGLIDGDDRDDFVLLSDLSQSMTILLTQKP